MAEKTTTKKTTTRASSRDGEKAAAAKAPAAKKAATATAEKPEKSEKATTTRKTAAKAAVATKEAAPKPHAVATAGKAITVRKRTAATVAKAKAAPEGEATGWRRFRRKTKVGVVISAKQAKTVIVTVGRMREHPLYKKVIRLRKGFAAHDEAGDVREGDLVRIQESRPYSATKRWKVVEVLSRAGEAGAAAPRVADVEKMLEEAEGVTEIFAKPEREDEAEEEEAK
jgi:small subunit ribosomal protein S17